MSSRHSMKLEMQSTNAMDNFVAESRVPRPFTWTAHCMTHEGHGLCQEFSIAFRHTWTLRTWTMRTRLDHKESNLELASRFSDDSATVCVQVKNVKIDKVRDGGLRGLVATANFKAGELVALIPNHCTVDVGHYTLPGAVMPCFTSHLPCSQTQHFGCSAFGIQHCAAVTGCPCSS